MKVKLNNFYYCAEEPMNFNKNSQNTIYIIPVPFTLLSHKDFRAYMKLPSETNATAAEREASALRRKLEEWQIELVEARQSLASNTNTTDAMVAAAKMAERELVTREATAEREAEIRKIQTSMEIDIKNRVSRELIRLAETSTLVQYKNL